MIPTMILFGLVLGRWWKVTVLLAAIAWSLMSILSDGEFDDTTVVDAAVLGAANAAVGAGMYLLVARVTRSSWARSAAPDADSTS